MTGAPTSPNPEQWRVERFDSLDSTNRRALDAARGGAPEGLVVVADHQTAGRGRLGRDWVAPPGTSLLVSVLLRPKLPAARLGIVTMAASLALAEAVERCCGITVGLKWPNDLVVGDRKLAGVLAEAHVDDGGGIEAVVVGAGCNLVWRDFPADLEPFATACNLESDAPVDPGRVLGVYLERLAARYAALDAVTEDYRARLVTLGRRVRVELLDGTIEGVAIGIDDDGGLLVELEPGNVMAVTTGDVVHVRAER